MNLGNLLALPVRILNIPARTFEKFIGDAPKEDRILSRPLESLAEAIEEATEDGK